MVVGDGGGWLSIEGDGEMERMEGDGRGWKRMRGWWGYGMRITVQNGGDGEDERGWTGMARMEGDGWGWWGMAAINPIMTPPPVHWVEKNSNPTFFLVVLNLPHFQWRFQF